MTAKVQKTSSFNYSSSPSRITHGSDQKCIQNFGNKT